MTTAPALTDPAAPVESLDQRLQAAVMTALDTLVALATNRSDPRHARLAAAEILRFAARRKPEPSPRPARNPAGNPRALTSGLGAMLDLFGKLPPPPPAHRGDDEVAPQDRHGPLAASPELANPCESREPGRHDEPSDPADQIQHTRLTAAQPAEERATPEQPRGRTPEPPRAPPCRDRFRSARKRKRDRRRAAMAQAAPRSISPPARC